jgi:hypothetical protein
MVFKYDNCANCGAVCLNAGTKNEGWYNSCNKLLIELRDCSDEDFSGGIELAKGIILGEDYNLWEDVNFYTQVTVEILNLSDYRGQILQIETETDENILEIEIYEGVIDSKSSQIWYNQDGVFLKSVSNKEKNPSLNFEISSAEPYSLVYISRPKEDNVPENLIINRIISFKEPLFANDYSQTFVTDFSTFPEYILEQLDNPYDFNNKMNLAYKAMKDLTGEEANCLDNEGHLNLIVKEIPYCGLAGNPIKMDPTCIVINHLNNGDPGFGPVHELGHDFTTHRSFCWGGDLEPWANFMAVYVYMRGIVPGYDIDYEGEYPFDEGLTMKKYWDNVWKTSNLSFDIFQGFMINLSLEYNWEITKTFFRKYNRDDSAINKSSEEQMKLSVKYLAESFREYTGKQEDYDYVINYLTEREFPSPDEEEIVSENVTCIFENSESSQVCFSEEIHSGCNYPKKCTIRANGIKGKIIVWQSSCTPKFIRTTIDGINKNITFDCSSSRSINSEEIVNNEGFSYAYFKCYSGFEKTFGSKDSCENLDSLKNYAKEFCEGECSEDNSKCGVSSFAVSGNCTFYSSSNSGEIYSEINKENSISTDFKENETEDFEVCENSCSFNDKCYPFGYRKSGEYCSEKGFFVNQLKEGKSCENNFECESNVCVGEKCINSNLIQKIINWFRKLFGRE